MRCLKNDQLKGIAAHQKKSTLSSLLTLMTIFFLQKHKRRFLYF